ncbi:MAG TPA: DoxX subfamily [Blastocatellia bacterium]|nr:DoxX subfamily [Blastocatellia bacterium]
MSRESQNRASAFQQMLLVGLRILIGWHFFYEGYYKLMLPGWSSDGVPLLRWTSTGYIRAATGPAARLFQRMLDAGWTPWIDNAVKIGLLLVGVSLILGLFTRTGCWGALFLLALFYISAIPVAGVPQVGAEGAYLVVNKTLIEAAAVCLVLAFDTGAIAGLDLLFAARTRRRDVRTAADTQPAAEPSAAAAMDA